MVSREDPALALACGTPPGRKRRRGTTTRLFVVGLTTILSCWRLSAGTSATQSTPTESTVEIRTPTRRLSATLALPASVRSPVLLILPEPAALAEICCGGRLPTTDHYHRLTDAARLRGLASLRLPAEYGTNDQNLDDLVEDAVAAIVWLRNDPRFESVTVVGHGVGSLVGMLAARAARADNFVSVAGFSRRGTQVVAERAGLRVNSALPVDAQIDLVAAAMRAYGSIAMTTSWARYLPTAEIARLRVPTLIMHGTSDAVVPVDEGERLMKANAGSVFRKVYTDHWFDSGPSIERKTGIAGSPLNGVSETVDALYQFIDEAPLVKHPEGQRRSLRSVVVAKIDRCQIAIEYGRPSRRGRVIWGDLVPWNRWWMPGADEATTLTTSLGIDFVDARIPAGDYTLYVDPAPDQTYLIFNRKLGQFHTEYDPTRDLARAQMSPTESAEGLEQLTFAITAQPTGGELTVAWDRRTYAARFTVSPSPGRVP